MALKQLLTLFFAVATFTASASAGDSMLYRSRIQISGGGGYRVSTGEYRIGEPADYLMPYRSNTWYLSMVHAVVFPFKKWGLMFSFKPHFVSFKKAEDQFEADVTARHPDYFISYSNHSNTDDLMSFMAGIVYRHESSRWNINIAALAGTTSFNKSTRIIHLKQKNANSMFKLVYGPEGLSAQDNFTLGISARTIYKLGKHVGLYAEVMPFYFFSSFGYKETITDLATGQSTERILNYRNNSLNFSADAGITFMINKKTRKKDRSK